MKNHAAATARNRILKGAALCGVLALSMTLTGCFVPPDDLSGDLSNQGVVYNTVAVTAPQRTATPTPSPTPTVESVFNFGTNTVMPTTQPGVITSNGIVTVVTTPPGSVATTARPTATPTPTAAAVLKKGSSGADVKTLQRRLKQLGYYTGSVDGDFGDATEKALRAFQDRNNLLVDGIAGKSTMAKLNSSNAVKAAAATATPRKTATPKPKTTATPNLSTEYYLQSGSSGTRVRTLQARLIELGWMAGSPDGNYEGATEYAVKAFQKKYKSLYTDGVAGPSTLQTLYSSSAAKSSTPVSSIGTTLESGMKNSGAVKAMQTRLKSLGYLTGTADGSFGDATKAAVIAFQTANGLKADGKAGTSTLNRLYSDAAIAASSMPTATASTSVDGYTTLSEGDTGTAVRNLQQALKNKGYYSGSVDGKYGAATTAAVVAFQSAQGLRVDGKAGPATQRALFTTSSSTDTSKYTTLRPGDSGAAIRQLQTTLKQKGYYTGTIDGDYGSGTTAAVKSFQKKMNITPVDGIAGDKTLTLLYSSDAVDSDEYATLRPGDTGAAVRTMQATLYELGYYDGSRDGVYGATTQDAVRAFQIRNKVTPVDGIAGNKTLTKLYSGTAVAAAAKTTEYKTLRKGYRGDGAFGQLCIVIPDRKITFIMLAEATNMQTEMDIIMDFIEHDSTPDGPDELPEDLYAPAPTAKTAFSYAWHCEENAAGIRALRLDCDGEVLRITRTDARGEETIRAGNGRYAVSNYTMTKLYPCISQLEAYAPFEKLKAAAYYTLEDGAVTVTLRHLESPHTEYWRFSLGEEPEWSLAARTGTFTPALRQPIRGRA